MSALHTIEIELIDKLKERPMAVDDVLGLDIDLGSQVSVFDLINKFLYFGLLEYDNNTGEFFVSNQ